MAVCPRPQLVRPAQIAEAPRAAKSGTPYRTALAVARIPFG